MTSSWFGSAALVLGLATSGHAEATTGLAFDWGVERRYQIKADVQMHASLPFNREKNRDVRVAEFIVGATVLCAPHAEVGKGAWEVHCAFEDVLLLAAPVNADAGRVLPVLDEFDEKYSKGAYAQLIVTSDGRVRSFDLEGVDKRNARIKEIHETMRLIMARAFAAFDLNLPKKGDDKGRTWKQATTMSMAFPSLLGTVGSAQIDSQVREMDGTVAVIDTMGEGTLGPGDTVGYQSGSEQVRDLFEISFQSVATLDTATGTLIERQYLSEGTPTASSVSAEGGAGISYVQAVRIVLIPEGTEAPALGANEETPLRRKISF